jgi:hypothetical protein
MHGGEDLGSMKVEAFAEMLQQKVQEEIKN